jgi:hypothetical protein
MDILQYISKLKNPLNTERRICKIINLMLTDSLDLFNKLNNSQKKVIMNSHRDIQKLDKIKNTNFNCSNEQLIKKIFNRYKDIYKFHKQNIQITEYKQPESFIPLETTIEPSIQRSKSIAVSKCQSIVQLWLDRNVIDKQNITEEEIKILIDKNITIPQLNECLIYLGHPTVQVSSVTTSNYNPEIIDSSLSEQPETARPPLLIKPETPPLLIKPKTPLKRSVSGIIPILKKNGVTKQAAELALSEELNAALVEYKREAELLSRLQENVKEAEKKLEEAIVNKDPTSELQNIYEEYLEEAETYKKDRYLKKKVKELKEIISPDKFNSYMTTIELMIESEEKLRKALIKKNPGYGDSLDRLLFLLKENCENKEEIEEINKIEKLLRKNANKEFDLYILSVTNNNRIKDELEQTLGQKKIEIFYKFTKEFNVVTKGNSSSEIIEIVKILKKGDDELLRLKAILSDQVHNEFNSYLLATKERDRFKDTVRSKKGKMTKVIEVLKNKKKYLKYKNKYLKLIK